MTTQYKNSNPTRAHHAIRGFCPTPCDADCDAGCHEFHAIASKRAHNPYTCFGYVFPAADPQEAK